jgi:sulfur carrier protein
MSIKVNGKEQKLTAPSIALLDLLGSEGVKKPEMVSVQLNGSFLRREDYVLTTVKDKDEVDFIYFMGGGQWGHHQVRKSRGDFMKMNGLPIFDFL